MLVVGGVDGDGIIPANTGKIQPFHGSPKSKRDHPREYGENIVSRGSVVSGLGSSPRIRGKCWEYYRPAPRWGIIPANTGKISTAQRNTAARRDHPREYGENRIDNIKGSLDEGSSPRIRGKCALRIPHHAWTGIIPANTGKMSLTLKASQTWWDHPREYGENNPKLSGIVSVSGSSPRIRGKCGRSFAAVDLTGIIPANTGKMVRLTASIRRARDHPREYGENPAETVQAPLQPGSSPRIRGKWGSAPWLAVPGGIIPANTGKMWRRRHGDWCPGDHPREYGENAKGLFPFATQWGIIPANTGKMR